MDSHLTHLTLSQINVAKIVLLLFYWLLPVKCVQSSICIANLLISYSIILRSTRLTY